jgi:hypothetical protein
MGAIADEPRKIPVASPALAFRAANEEHSSAAANDNDGLADLLDLRFSTSRGDQFVQAVSMRWTKSRDRTLGTFRFARAADSAAEFHQSLIESARPALWQKRFSRMPEQSLGVGTSHIAAIRQWPAQ